MKCFTHFFVQNETSKDLLAKIGLTNVTITGDTRFDRVLQIKEAAKDLPIIEQFVSAPTPHSPLHTPQIFVAGSSWPPDEEIFLRYYNGRHPEWKLIIAPHVIDEEHLQQINLHLKNRKVVRYTSVIGEFPSNISDLRNADVLVVDCFGLLSSIYRFATVCYVGGGFGVGIHNVVEAAVWGKPVFFGPNNQRFMEAQELKECGGGIEITSYDDFANSMNQFATDAQAVKTSGEAAAECVSRRSGATERIFSYLKL